MSDARRISGHCRCGCGEPVYGHLADYRRGHRPTRDLADRLWAKVQKGHPGECWEWTGYANRAGYGQISVGGGSRALMGTHRAAWQVTHGAVPRGLFVCHHCDNPRCCNPSHLFLGTNADNIADAVAKGRLKGRPKVTDDQVAALRSKYVRHYATGRGGTRSNARELAAEYGLSVDHVNAVVNYRERGSA